MADAETGRALEQRDEQGNEVLQTATGVRVGEPAGLLDVHADTGGLHGQSEDAPVLVDARVLAGPRAQSAHDAPRRDKMYPRGAHPMLRYCQPYWWPFRTFVKQRWIGRQLLEVVASEFRERSVDYYRHALECGVTRVNGATAYPEYVLRNGDRIDNTVHRHEPPISNDPVLVLHVDEEREFLVVSKPGSMPVHAAGRYFKHTMLEVLKEDYGIKGYAVNRLDRLTSGLMILGLTGPASNRLAQEFQKGKVQKEYVARVRGKFPEGEVLVDQPLLTIDRHSGLVIVAPQGKEAKTVFTRMSYDAKRDQSVLHCRPLTGRTHQIRVHLQYLGYPIANDPLYASESVWGPSCGQGGMALVDEADPLHSGPERPTSNAVPDDAARYAGIEAGPEVGSVVTGGAKHQPGKDGSAPILLSSQARGVIAELRRQRDEAEDFMKWQELVFSIKAEQDAMDEEEGSLGKKGKKGRRYIPPPSVNSCLKRDKAAEREMFDTLETPLRPPAHVPEGFCPQCFVPVPDDPNPADLFIYLHALRYTTEALGTWETPLPRWAGREWDGDWRGWDGQEPVSAVSRSTFASRAQTRAGTPKGAPEEEGVDVALLGGAGEGLRAEA